MIGGLSFLVNGNVGCGVSTAFIVRVALERALAEPHVRAAAGRLCVHRLRIEAAGEEEVVYRG